MADQSVLSVSDANYEFEWPPSWRQTTDIPDVEVMIQEIINIQNSWNKLKTDIEPDGIKDIQRRFREKFCYMNTDPLKESRAEQKEQDAQNLGQLLEYLENIVEEEEMVEDAEEKQRIDNMKEERRANDMKEEPRATGVKGKQRADDVKEEQRTVDIKEEQRTDDVKEDQRANDIKEERKADNMKEGQRADDVKDQRVDDVKEEQRADDTEEKQRMVDEKGKNQLNFAVVIEKSMVQHAHKIVCSDTMEKDWTKEKGEPGNFSTGQRCTEYEGELYEYPVPEDMVKAVDEILDSFNSLLHHACRKEDKTDRLKGIFKSLAWFLFEILDLHPFGNGNGRVFRAFCHYVLFSCGQTVVPCPLYNVCSDAVKEDHSPCNKPCKDSYLKALVKARKSTTRHPKELATMLVESCWKTWKEFIEEINTSIPKK